jgi:hypothetical protein
MITATTSAERAQRPRLFRVVLVDNQTQEQTPISDKPVSYEEAMRIKSEAEASKKYDLGKGFLAALRLTDDEYDRYEAQMKAASPQSQQPAKKTGKTAAEEEA